MRPADFLSSPLRPLFALSFGLAALAPGCDSGPSCAIDTDCLLGEYCSASGQCLELGSTGDGGGRDAGGGETGPRDASTDVRVDARPTDAPVAVDDAPAEVCADLVGNYSISAATPCTAISMMTITGPAPSECAFEVALDGRGAGAIARVDDTTFSGMISLVEGTPETCTATHDAAAATLQFTCGACVFDADRADP
jgi:hypothetical protein